MGQVAAAHQGYNRELQDMTGQNHYADFNGTNF